MSPPRETWFDRISAPHTRRQSLKAAAAGAAAAVGATLPFAGKLPEAGAATPTDCRKGCVYMVNKRFAQESAIDATYFGTSAYIASKGLGPFYGIFSSLFYLGGRLAVADQRWARQRQELPACFHPFCPGFNPKAPGGPCDGCEPPLFCIPCELVDSGYICCIYEPADCHGDCCHPSPGCL